MIRFIKEVCIGVFYVIVFIAAILYIREKMEQKPSKIIDLRGEKIICSLLFKNYKV